jgi:hypothetical protein
MIMTNRLQWLAVPLLWLALPALTSWSHFLWLVPQKDNGSSVQLYFSEGPEPDNPKLLEKLANCTTQAFTSNEASATVPLSFSEDRSQLGAAHRGATAWSLNHLYGVHGRETKNLIRYTALSIPCGWAGMSSQDRVKMPETGIQATVQYDGHMLEIQLHNDGKPASGLVVEMQSPNDQRTLVADATGMIRVDEIRPGVAALRCLQSDATLGVHEGVAYQAVNHYTTISFRVPELKQAMVATSAGVGIEALPEPVTSFGAATDGTSLYVYGGHTGSAHSYSHEEQFNRLIRWDLPGERAWKTIATGPHVQGNALLPWKNGVILLGGFNAENATGEKARLVSVAGVAHYDSTAEQWESLPDLPEPRSSTDATVLGDTIYVVGGWTMNGKSSETKWLKTGWKLSLGADKAHRKWEAIADPPFERRAMAVIAHAGKVFVIGGMGSDGGPTTACNLYDPASDQWSEIDSIAGVAMNGFGAAAAEVDGRLIVTTEDGSIQRWDAEHERWEIIGCIPTGRFFHRMLPLPDHRVVLLGGANMDVGKFDEAEIITLSP